MLNIKPDQLFKWLATAIKFIKTDMLPIVLIALTFALGYQTDKLNEERKKNNSLNERFYILQESRHNEDREDLKFFRELLGLVKNPNKNENNLDTSNINSITSKGE